MATLTNWNWNTGLKAGQTYRMIFIVTGAARTLLPGYTVRYFPGRHEDMSCTLENNHDWEDTTVPGTRFEDFLKLYRSLLLFL